jgi:AcrR family transcriptional regulator
VDVHLHHEAPQERRPAAATSTATTDLDFPSGEVMPAKVADAEKRIRACTLAEIEKNGIVGMRVANIAKKADVSVPLIYKLFGDREQLLATVLSETIEDFYLNDINNIRALVEATDTDITVDVLLQALPMPSDAFRLKQRKLRTLIFAASHESPKLLKAVGKSQQTIQNATCDLIRYVRERSGSTVPVDDQVISFAILAMGFSFVFNDVNPDKPLSDTAYRAFMADFLNRYLLT